MRYLHSSEADRKEIVRVLVVDDHALFAEALMLTLGIDERIEVVGSASSGVEAVSLAEALRPDVVLGGDRRGRGRRQLDEARHRDC